MTRESDCIPIAEVVIGDRLREDMGDLNLLAESIARLGLLQPIVLRPDKTLVAGARRLIACRDILHWTHIPARVVDSLSEVLAALQAERDENTCRKDFNPVEAVQVGKLLEPLEQQAAKERQQKAGENFGRGIASCHWQEAISTGESIDRVAAALNMGGNTYRRAKSVVEAAEKAPEKYGDLAERMAQSGNVNSAFVQLKQRQTHERLKEAAPLPADTYEVILADPPWDYDFTASSSRSVQNHYPTMALEAICALNVGDLAAKDSVLFLWVTPPKLPDGLRVLESWGFTYVTCAIWDKQHFGMGYYFRQQHEILLVGKKGALPSPLPETRPASVLRSARTAHSEKPEAVYAALETMYPTQKRLELFARQARPGWSVWGNQVVKS